MYKTYIFILTFALDDLFDKELYENDLKQIAFEKGDSIEKVADDLVEDIEIIKEIVEELRLQ